MLLNILWYKIFWVVFHVLYSIKLNSKKEDSPKMQVSIGPCIIDQAIWRCKKLN